MSDYKAAGVDIDAGNETVRRIRSLARGTFTAGVLSDIGSFGNFSYPVRSGETMIELMYQTPLTKWWTVQPDCRPIFPATPRKMQQSWTTIKLNWWLVTLKEMGMQQCERMRSPHS